MKTKLSLYCLLLSLLLPKAAFPIYDILSVDLKPTDNDLQFCFAPDYPNPDWRIYLAAILNNQFYFVDSDQHPMPWSGTEEPPFFAKKGLAVTPVCFPPQAKTTLQGIPVYAGVGNSLADIQTNARYLQIFDGSLPTLPQPTKAWTVMVYVVGSNLESSAKHWASQDLMEMLRGTKQMTTDQINTVVTTGGSQRYGWNTVKRTTISHGQQYVLADLGSKSMADPQTLSDFVLWAKTNFPAQHYALILWNHGDGANGYGFDTSDAGKNNLLHLPELHQAYQTIRQQLDKPLDIVVYDACLMSSIEVAEVTATVANAMAGSAELEPGHGLNYEYLLTHLADTSPADGIAFGKIVKAGYLQQSQDQGTLKTSQITYSVLDLSQLKSFTDTFAQFATEFNRVLTDTPFLSYEMLSHGIIRAPGYPFRETGKFLRSLNDKKHVRVDLYNILQTVIPELPQLKVYADDLQAKLKHIVVDYDTNDNVKAINQEAGRVSLDIGGDKSYQSILPPAYTLLHQALDYYNQRRAEDPSTPNNGGATCLNGITCGDAHWLNLQKDEVMGIEGYYGQQTGDVANLYLIKTLLQYPNYPEDPNIGGDGREACQYQLCVNDTQCDNLTVKKQSLTTQRYQLLADVQVNQSPAVLTFCGTEDTWQTDTTWPVCSMVSQTNNIWGRDDNLSPNDTVTVNTLVYQNKELKQQPGNTLTVAADKPVTLKRTCDASKVAIVAAYYGINGQREFDTLCDNKGLANCFCQTTDFNPAPEGDEGCKKLNMKSGVYLTE